MFEKGSVTAIHFFLKQFAFDFLLMNYISGGSTVHLVYNYIDNENIRLIDLAARFLDLKLIQHVMDAL